MNSEILQHVAAEGKKKQILTDLVRKFYELLKKDIQRIKKINLSVYPFAGSDIISSIFLSSKTIMIDKYYDLSAPGEILNFKDKKIYALNSIQGVDIYIQQTLSRGMLLSHEYSGNLIDLIQVQCAFYGLNIDALRTTGGKQVLQIDGKHIVLVTNKLDPQMEFKDQITLPHIDLAISKGSTIYSPQIFADIVDEYNCPVIDDGINAKMLTNKDLTRLNISSQAQKTYNQLLQSNWHFGEAKKAEDIAIYF